MTTRYRAGPRSMAAIFAFTAILAATMLIAATPASAIATTQTKLQQYNEAPAINQAAIAAPADYGSVSEVTSPPDVAWMSSNQVFANYTATTAYYSDNVLGAANDFKKQYDAVNHGKMVSLNFTLGTARAAPATNDFKTTAADG